MIADLILGGLALFLKANTLVAHLDFQLMKGMLSLLFPLTLPYQISAMSYHLQLTSVAFRQLAELAKSKNETPNETTAG